MDIPSRQKCGMSGRPSLDIPHFFSDKTLALHRTAKGISRTLVIMPDERIQWDRRDELLLKNALKKMCREEGLETLPGQMF